MARSVPLSDLRSDPTLLRSVGDQALSITSDDGVIIASVPSRAARSVLYKVLDDLLAGIEVDDADMSVIHDNWLE